MLDDAAQAFGATYKGRKVGTLAPATATSFFPAKPLGCFGDGGAVLTDDDALADLINSLRVHGQGTDKYDNVRIGLTGRLDTIQAAVLIEKLKIFPDEIAARDRIAQPLCRRPRRCRERAAGAARLHLGVGAIHDPPGARAPRWARRRAEGAGHPDRDLLSKAAAPAAGLSALSRWPTAACRPASAWPTK